MTHFPSNVSPTIAMSCVRPMNAGTACSVRADALAGGERGRRLRGCCPSIVTLWDGGRV